MNSAQRGHFRRRQHSRRRRSRATKKKGVAWVFKRSGAVWSLREGLDSCEEREFPPGICIKREEESKGEPGYFGASVAISGNGDTILVGAPRDGQGSVWVYQKTPEGTEGFEYLRQGAKKTADRRSGARRVWYRRRALGRRQHGPRRRPGRQRRSGAAWVLTRSGFKWTQQGSKLTGDGCDAAERLRGQRSPCRPTATPR